ncbi:SRPBCC family protein [Guptibacillus hwajinpoensis]|uniref:Membrane protein n=1 Tax=Guptibacillus hwajinpoensis TaxID=208199 RepID=A0ABU0K6E7_9BACL|nr:SRPBCC family protein [Alkalihalobacillus hemicentroti]MDQ0484061.1 putative membrane protein [Alkalihalobacillus hemicentroti]
MSQIFTETVTINAPLEEVWNYFINLEENAPNWMKGIQAMGKETTGEIHQGTNYLFHARGKRHSSTVTEFVPKAKVTLTSVQGNFQADYTYSFSSENTDHTKLTLNASCDARGMSMVFSPVIKMAIKKSDRDQVNLFKEAFLNRGQVRT